MPPQLSDLIAEHRGDRTTKDLAAEVGMSADTIQSWSSGRRAPYNQATILRLAEALGVTVDEVTDAIAARPRRSVTSGLAAEVKRLSVQVDRLAALADRAERRE